MYIYVYMYMHTRLCCSWCAALFRHCSFSGHDIPWGQRHKSSPSCCLLLKACSVTSCCTTSLHMSKRQNVEFVAGRFHSITDFVTILCFWFLSPFLLVKSCNRGVLCLWRSLLSSKCSRNLHTAFWRVRLPNMYHGMFCSGVMDMQQCCSQTMALA